MENSTQNPLVKHFRQPSIYIKLPSNGKYWTDGGLDLPASGEIPVFPMTVRDEIVLRTPDALMNGTGVVETIQSCCPNIKNAWLAPNIDMDAILIAIRIASYGHNMDLETQCPKCQQVNEYTADLRSALESIVCPNFEEPILVNDLKIILKPQPYEKVNVANTLGFEEQKMISSINESQLSPEEKAKAIAEQMKKVIDITSEILVNSTEYIETSQGEKVTNPAHIKEFYQNAESKIIKAIQKRVEEITQVTSIKPYLVKCTNCQHEFNMSIDFDFSSFFATGF